MPQQDIDKVIEAAMLEPYGAILATPVADTLKQSYAHSTTQSNPVNEPAIINSTVNSSSYSYARRTIDRSNMWQAQTPQVFRLDQLQRVLTYVAENQLEITDEASAFEHLEMPIRLVSGSRQNIKLTYPDDAILLTAILSAQS